MVADEKKSLTNLTTSDMKQKLDIVDEVRVILAGLTGSDGSFYEEMLACLPQVLLLLLLELLSVL